MARGVVLTASFWLLIQRNRTLLIPVLFVLSVSTCRIKLLDFKLSTLSSGKPKRVTEGTPSIIIELSLQKLRTASRLTSMHPPSVVYVLSWSPIVSSTVMKRKVRSTVFSPYLDPLVTNQVVLSVKVKMETGDQFAIP